jgi:hypothetical protein
MPGYAFVHPKKLDVPLLPGFTIEDARDNIQVKIMALDGVCDCFMKTSFGLQCWHELTLQGKFIERKWATRWFNRYYLREINADYCMQLSDNIRDFSMEHHQGNTETTADNLRMSVTGTPKRASVDDQGYLQEFSIMPISPLSPLPAVTQQSENQRLNYNYLQQRSTELIRAATGDNVAMASVAAAIESMTQFVQNQQRYFTVTITVPEA